jgi:O-antigen/teichoic acid export membrane protein
MVLLIISLGVATGTAFNVFGGVINGFQRYDLNNVVGAASSVVTAAVNVAVLAAGYGLVELVAATTTVRLVTYLIYRANAYRVFPGLRIRLSSFRRERLREVTLFSVYMLVIDCANKMNYSLDAIVIGGFLSMSAVAVWTVGQRVAEMTQRLTNQLNDVLFPTVVDNSAAARKTRLQTIFVQGTRLSLGTVVPIAGAVILMAGPLVRAWVGTEFSGSVIVLQLLSLVVIIRVGNATAGTVLKGAGRHRLVAFTNLAAAFVNLGLGIAFVKSLGLPGVAIATLVPVGIASTVVLFPAACRRVEIPLWRALVEAVWPATWPAVIMTAIVLATRDLIAPSLLAVAAEIAAACIVYGIVFVFFGISARHRHLYVSKAAELMHRRPAAHVLPEGT